MWHDRLVEVVVQEVIGRREGAPRPTGDYVCPPFPSEQSAQDSARRAAQLQVDALVERLRNDDVPEEEISKEKEIASAQAEGKPAHAIEKIVEGKINKWLSQVCLLEQPFVKNNDQTIGDLVKEKITTIGENIIIRRFTRFQIGE